MSFIYPSRPPSSVSAYHVDLYSSTEFWVWNWRQRTSVGRRGAGHVSATCRQRASCFGIRLQPLTFNTPPTPCWRAWLARFWSVLQFETQRRINILSVSYVHFLAHLTLSLYFDRRDLWLFLWFTTTHMQPGTRKSFWVVMIRCVKEFWNNKKHVLDPYKYFQHQLASTFSINTWRCLFNVFLKYFTFLWQS